MEIEKRTILEVDFIESIKHIINSLDYSGISDEDLSVFEKTLKTFIKFSDIGDFVLDSLLEKIKQIAAYTKYKDQAKLSFFKKISKLFIHLGDEESINVLVTHLLSNTDLPHFFIFLEEMVMAGCNIQQVEKTFSSLIYIRQYNPDMIKKYLDIIGKDYSYLSKYLIQNKEYYSVSRLIRASSLTNIREQIIPPIMEYYDGNLDMYLMIASVLTEISSEFCSTLLNNHKYIGPCEKEFTEKVASYNNYNFSLIRNFANYLSNNNEKYSKFEDMFINDEQQDGRFLIHYAINIPNCNKRKILYRLLKDKDEELIVEFIKNFPKFSSLLPML